MLRDTGHPSHRERHAPGQLGGLLSDDFRSPLDLLKGLEDTGIPEGGLELGTTHHIHHKRERLSHLLGQLRITLDQGIAL